VEREILNHRMLMNANVVSFKEVSSRPGGTICSVSAVPTASTCAVFLHRSQLTSCFVAVVMLQLYLTPTHLCIVMEYAAGGELFDRIVKAGRFSEDEARYFFQQLICGVDYCHQSVSYLSRTHSQPCSLL